MAKRRARGEGSLRKRSDGRWEGRYTTGRDPETGKLIYRNVLARTQAECKSKLREAMKNIQLIQKIRSGLLSVIRQESGSAPGLRSIPNRTSGKLHRTSTPTSWKSM